MKTASIQDQTVSTPIVKDPDDLRDLSFNERQAMILPLRKAYKQED